MAIIQKTFTEFLILLFYKPCDYRTEDGIRPYVFCS